MKAITGARRITKVVITRSREGNAELAAKLEAEGFEPVAIDSLEFLPPVDWSDVDAGLAGLGEFDWLLFTSATGAEFFARRMKALSLPFPWHGRPVVAAVGEKTSAALQRVGLKVDFVPSAYLTKALADQLPRGRGNKVLILRPDLGDPDVVPSLERDGFVVTDLAIYRTSALAAGGDEAEESAIRSADAIIFASPSAVEAFMKRFASAKSTTALARKLLAICIGPVTATAAKRRGFESVLTPKVHTLESVLQCLHDAAEGEGK